MRINLGFCGFDNGTKSVVVVYNSFRIDVTYLKRVLLLPNLEPGSEVNINLFAVGQNGKISSPFHISAFTRPSDPYCSNISYFATNESIEVDTRYISSHGAKYYNITLGGKAQIKSTDDKYIFNFLLPGKTYNVSVRAVGDGNQISLNRCYIQLFTRPKGPVCVSSKTKFITDITSNTIKVDLNLFAGDRPLCVYVQPTQKIEPICKALQNNVAIVRSLTPSTLYNLTAYSYINDTEGQQLLSVESCSVGEHYTRPKGPDCESNEAKYVTDITTTTIKVDLSSFTGNNFLCVKVQPKPQKEPMCKPFQNNIAIIRSLTPSTLYNLTLYSYINDTDGQQLLSVESCSFDEYYTVPQIDCANVSWNPYAKAIFIPREAVQNIKQLNFTVTSQDNNTIIKTYSFAVSKQDTYFLHTVSGRSYSVLVTGQGVDGSWTPEPCSINFSTSLPYPKCPPEALEVSSKDMRIKLYLCTFDNGTKSAQVVYNSFPIDVTYLKQVVYLPNLEPGSQVNINIFAYGQNGIKSLPFHITAFTRPKGPVCASNETKYVTIITTTTIKVDLSSLTGNTFLCVKAQPKPEIEPVCKPLKNNVVTIRSLTPSTLYNFTIYSYINDTKVQQLLSIESCSVGEHYTMPQLDCPNVSWNQYAKAMFIPKEAVQNIKQLNFTVISQDNNTIINMYSFAISETDTYFLKTMYGKSYSVLLAGQGVDGTWTSEPCCINFSTPLPAPECPPEALKINSRDMRLNLELCSFDNRTKSAQVNYNSLPKDTTYLEQVVYLPNLEPGREVYINIFAIGQNGLKSSPFHFSAFTRPSDPNCSKLLYSATNESIEIETRNLSTDGAIQYNITLGGKVQIKSTEDEYIFKPLLPGKMYNVSMIAIGAGNQTSLNGCHIQLFTRPSDPNCSKLLYSATNESIEIDTKNLLTGGTIQYSIKWGGKAQIISTEHKYTFYPLLPGKMYNVSVTVMGDGNQTSLNGCHIQLFTSHDRDSTVGDTELNSSTVIGASISVVLSVFIIMIAVIVYLKRTGKGPFRPQNDTYENTIQMKFLENQASKSVLTSNFTAYLQQMHSEKLLCKEFKEISANTQHLHDNVYENQQSDLDTRSAVPLDFRRQEISAFPNAKFLPGFSSKREYICSQHPNEATLENFFNILFENKINIVVMILNDIIQEEVFQYWPVKVQDTFKHGRFVIGLENQTSLAQNIFKELVVTKDGVKSHSIKHFQFTVTRNEKKDVDSFVNFAKSVKTIWGHSTKKTMTKYVHCRDGSGWSGVYIAVDILLQQVRQEGCIEIRNLVEKLKKYHPRIIQTEEQYVFLHDCVKKYIRSDLITVEEDHTYQQLDRANADTDTYEELP